MAVDKNSISGDLVFPPNSDKARDAVDIKPNTTPELKKVVSGNVIVKKKSPGRRFLNAFLNEDRKSIKDYLLYDFAVPALQSMISDIGRSVGDAFSNAVDIALFGDVRAKPKSSGNIYGNSIYNYNAKYNYGKKTLERSQQRVQPQKQERFDLGDVCVRTKVEAENVIASLRDRITFYDQATLLDLQCALGVTGEWTDASWGWDDLSMRIPIENVRVFDEKEGKYVRAWRIDFPPPQPLD